LVVRIEVGNFHAFDEVLMDLESLLLQIRIIRFWNYEKFQ
jgi:hypothetical protein